MGTTKNSERKREIPRKLEEVYDGPFAAQGIPGGLIRDKRRYHGLTIDPKPGSWVPGYEENVEPPEPDYDLDTGLPKVKKHRKSK